MTVILGQRRPKPCPDVNAQRRAEWIQHFQRPTRTCTIPTSLPPVPLAEIATRQRPHDTKLSVNRFRKGGVVDLYAWRLEAQKATRMRPDTPPTIEELARRYPGAVVHTTRSIGRGTPEHDRNLYPARPVRLPQMPARPGKEIQFVSDFISSATSRSRSLNPVHIVRTVRAAMANSSHGARMWSPRKAVLASAVAVMLMASVATSSLAQQRYEVQAGDTIESIAADFGVDPEAIYRSSYMPNGWSVEAGQVIIIPDQGQSPADAASMAAANEGTSPWVSGAHWVEYGDTYNSIAANYGVDVDALIAFNAHVEPTNLVPGERILIPAERGEVGTTTAEPVQAPAAESSSAGSGVQLGVPNYVQQRNLSCEYAATYAATAVYGDGVSEWTFMEEVPHAANPHYGYRGNIDGWWGNTDDYGVYAEALVPVLNQYGYGADVFYTGGDINPLIAQLDAGRPVVVWMGFWGDTREVLADDGSYSLFAGMHVVTVTGYDEGGVYVMDPAKGVTQYYDWASFQVMWSVIDGMSMAVYPAG